ncbi:MAG TPA: hypothetical protein VFO19_07405 [Vicinamibacterales bacterium]|nr:hypothetical protein [Vicinamibacterales bacterium]
MAGVDRTRQQFPSRQYRYPYAVPEARLQADEPADPREMLRFIAGRDAAPVPLGRDEARAKLHDPFVRLVLLPDGAAGPPPMSLRAVLAAIDATPMTETRSFVVADGGQIPWSQETNDLQRNFRLAIVRQAPGEAQPDILISGSTDIDSPTNFLQVIGWDNTVGAYQFYERRLGRWVWAGSSWDALAPASRAHGPFDSHINGALNMKELKFPWLHWHSPSAAITDEVLAAGDPLRGEPLWTGRRLADEFERTIVRPGIRRWTDSRFTKRIVNGSLTRLHEFFRQVLGTSTVNLISSPTSSAAVAAGQDVRLPLTFLIDADALLGTLELEPDVPPLVVPAAAYRSSLARFDVKVGDGQFTFAGDTHFVFVVPEAAFEDGLVLEQLIGRGVLSPHLAASLLMVDFENPVFSRKRASLLTFVPDSARLGDPEAFTSAFADAVRASAGASIPGRAEHELLANLALPADEWRSAFTARLTRFLQRVAPGLTTAAAFAPLFELAESRRREFRRRPLAEFRLTTPITNIPETAPLLEIGSDAVVRPKSEVHMALTRFDAPGFLDDLDAPALAEWSRWVSDQLDAVRDRDGGGDFANYGPRLQFFNPLRTPAAADAVTKDIDWPAFPRVVQINSATDRQRWRTADSSRDNQDEYCEWSVTRDPQTDRITRVTFTSEGPEYWQFLAAAAPARVLELYRQHISPDVERSHLFQNGKYVSRNRWNNSTTNGAMHLVQRSNTLGAEIELAAAATIVRLRNGAPITEAQALIACGQYGEPQRHSDPHIGAMVNELARAKHDLTLANPIGLYIAGLSVAGWATPDGSDPASFWTITRGTKEKALRAVYEVPAGRGFVVGDITIDGRKIEFGAQIADFIRIKLTGLATRLGQSTVAPFNGCVESTTQDDAAAGPAAPPKVAAVLAGMDLPITR